MLFITASFLGIATGMMRSAFCVSLVAVLLVATFALAALVFPGPPSYLGLLVAVLGYNFGIVSLVAGAAFARRSSAA